VFGCFWKNILMIGSCSIVKDKTRLIMNAYRREWSARWVLRICVTVGLSFCIVVSRELSSSVGRNLCPPCRRTNQWGAENTLHTQMRTVTIATRSTNGVNTYISDLSQMLSNNILVSYFSLSCKPRLEHQLYQQLRLIVAHEDEYIDDNYNEMKEEIRIKIPDN